MFKFYYCLNQNDSNQILFDEILTVVEKGLIKQKKYIWKNFEKEENENKESFNELCMFGIKKEDEDDSNNNKRLRQDEIPDGIKPEENELSMLLLEAQVGNGSTFNVPFENNSKVYSTQCLTFAHSNNIKFQEEMKWYFKRYNCQYQSAPVKTYDRILVKSTTDYADQSHPTVANILDFMRFRLHLIKLMISNSTSF